jgi:hypothetical protein
LPKTKTPSLCYVYCVVEGRAPALPATGMPDGSAPRAVSLDDEVAVIVSDVDAGSYAAEALEPRLSDLDWVSGAGAAHHAVIDAIAESGATVLPFRLFTLFSSENKATTTLRETRPAMARAFGRVRDKQEWVLRIGKPEPSRAEPAQHAPPPARTSGTNFLQARAEAKREAAARATRVREDAAAAYEALEQLADAAKTRPVDTAGNLLLDAAFLVPPARVEAMRETLSRRAERLLRDGCPVSLTGPWPPYSFASMDAASNG